MVFRFMVAAGVLLAPLVPLTLPVSAAATAPHRVKSAPVHRAALTSEQGLGEVRVASANIREGAAGMFRHDLADGTDRAAFARRLLGSVRPVPDIVLVQEALGRANVVAGAINRHPRARNAGARYAVAVAPGLTTSEGDCDGPRTGPFTVLRDSAILVNQRTVSQVLSAGVVRTWGRWGRHGSKRIGNGGYGCAEHPWVQLTVQHPGKAPRTARVMSAHVAPRNLASKTRAVQQIAAAMQQHRAASPHELSVIGGDFNLNRCDSRGVPETADCTLRAGHQAMQDAGYTDAVRVLNLRGPTGVVGVLGRIDFIYTADPVLSSGFDRCYRAYRVKRHRCQPGAAVFTGPRQFRSCQQRALYGRASGSCPSHRYRRYYSDHPLQHATVG